MSYVNYFKIEKYEKHQDNFLRWILENYNCEHEEIKSLAKKLIITLFDNNCEVLEKYNEIQGLEVELQKPVCNVRFDMVLHFIINKRKYICIIEDKINHLVSQQKCLYYSLRNLCL